MRILIADNRTLVRQGFRALLKSYGDFTSCCEASDGETAVEQALEFKPDVAVLGITMEEPNGLHALREIQQNIPDLPLVILYGNEPAGLVETTKALKIKAYVSTSASGKELIEVVERVARGQPRSQGLSQELSGNLDQQGMARLKTPNAPQIRSEEDNS
jgi:DNA-binding NarL/FixJ family response regulator